MRLKFLSLGFMLLFLSSSPAQVLNSGITLKQGKYYLGFNPAVLSDNFGIFFQGGYGLKSGMDIGLKIGVGYPDIYVGADLEFLILRKAPYFSVSTGAHYFGDIGVDGTGIFTIPFDQQVHFYTGLDMDINFNDDKTRIPLWFLIGTEVAFKSNMSVLLEAEIGLNDPASNIFSGGFNIYF